MKMWRKAVSAGLVLAMTVGLCACGGGKGSPGFISKNKGTTQDPALAKQYVYSETPFDLSGLQTGSGELYVQRAMKFDDRVYLVIQNYNWEMNPDGPTYMILSMKLDGSDPQSYTLQGLSDEDRIGAGGKDDADTDAEPGTDEGAASDSEQEAQKPEGDEDAVADIDADFDVDMGWDPGYNSVYEYTDFGNFQIIKDGYLCGTLNYSYQDYSDMENPIYRNETYVCRWGLDGKLENAILLEDLQSENSWSYIVGLAAMEDGTVALMLSGDQTGVRILGTDGKLSALKQVSAKEEIFERSNGWAVMPGGKLLVSYYDKNWSNTYLATYDMKTDTLSEGYKLPKQLSYNDISRYVISEDGEFSFCYNQFVYKYHIGDEEPTSVMSFVNSDLEIDYLDPIIMIDDDHFMGWYTTYNEETYHSEIGGGIFTRVDPKDIPDKEVLVLGGSYIDNRIRKRVVDFNKTSSTYRIVLKDYSEYITYDEEWNADYTQLNNDIISGNMPDILIVDGYGMSVENLASKGLLADIGSLIKNDEELAGTEFMENVFEACKIDGKLYEIIPSFSVNTYIAKKSIVGDKTSWTMEEAQSLVNSMPENTKLFGELTRPGFFSILMNFCGSDFVDVSTGKCKFDSPEFISLMEYAKLLPEEYNEDYYDENWYNNYQSQYRENRTILGGCYISSFRDLVYQINGMFGEEVSYIGFPNASGQGSVINVYNSYVLSAKSANLDVAWEFMRYYLTEEYQSTLEWQLPITKKQFDVVAQKGTERPYYTDENGNKIEYDDSFWMNDEQIPLPPLSQKQVDDTKEFVAQVNKRAYNNVDISKIISEEMDAFYKGQKSAADVAAIIQSRAQIYVNENR